MDERPLRVALVCTGNTCRSPMAEALLRAMLRDRPSARPIEVLSAGTGAFPGDPATPQAVAVLAERSIDLSGHRSRPISVPLLETVDLVLTMTARHKDAVLRMAPPMEGRVFTLAEAAAGALRSAPADTARRGDAGTGAASSESEYGDVPDPIGSDDQVYRETADRIESYLRAILDDLERFPSRSGGGAE